MRFFCGSIVCFVAIELRLLALVCFALAKSELRAKRSCSRFGTRAESSSRRASPAGASGQRPSARLFETEARHATPRLALKCFVAAQFARLVKGNWKTPTNYGRREPFDTRSASRVAATIISESENRRRKQLSSRELRLEGRLKAPIAQQKRRETANGESRSQATLIFVSRSKKFYFVSLYLRRKLKRE